jgi:hypothetical protein
MWASHVMALCQPLEPQAASIALARGGGQLLYGQSMTRKRVAVLNIVSFRHFAALLDTQTFMRNLFLLFLAFVTAGSVPCAAAGQQPVLTFHGKPDRSGHFVAPALTFERARALHLDQDFQARFPGHVYAQPLYWRAPSADFGLLLVAAEDDAVYALDAKMGKEIWSRSLGTPVPRSSLSCGNIDPLGITGTPAIDPGSEALYLDAMADGPEGPRHLVFALSLKDGSILPGWPVDVADALKTKGETFIARDQNERGALVIMDGMVYMPFGGHLGDCGSYHALLSAFR